MNVRLVIERGGRRKIIPMRKTEAILGRGHGNALRIPSAEVSRQHCRLIQRDGLVHIRDLGSVNGTFLNDERIKAEEIVRPGDKIDVGPIRFVVEYELTPEALDRLQGMNGIDVEDLSELSDGDIVEVDVDARYGDDEVSVEMDDDGGLALFENLEELAPAPIAEPDPVKKKKKKPALLDDEPTMPAESLETIAPDFNFDAGNWQMPAGGDLAGLLDSFEDEQPPTKSAKPKKKK